MDDLIQKLKEANDNYRIGTPIMSDAEYDNLVDDLKEKGIYPYEDSVEPEPLYKGHIKHKNPLLSTNKAKLDEDMYKWIDSVEKSANKLGIDLVEVEIRATQKLDGIASVYHNGILATRGNGIEGNNITRNIDRGLVMPMSTSKDPILGELVIDLDYFNDHLFNEFSHSRNFTSGTMMSDTLSPEAVEAFKNKKLVMRAYDELPCSFTNLIYTRANFREIEEHISSIGIYNIDGVIFEATNREIKDDMGRNDHHNHWQIALKPKDKEYQSVVTEIEWKTGRTGKVTPTILFETIDIDGVKVSRATGHNAGYVRDNSIVVGSVVNIIRSGSVIPYITGVNK